MSVTLSLLSNSRAFVTWPMNWTPLTVRLPVSVAGRVVDLI